MEVLFALPLILLPFFWPVVTGLMAKSFGRKFWFWFFVGIPLPFIAMVILLCLPDKRKRLRAIIDKDGAVANDEIFQQLISIDKKDKKISDEVYFSATA